MVSAVYPPGVREIIQSIKEIVRNHSDAEIYSVLKESNMDPNETTQKLLNQDPFHEVKKKRDRKKENSGYNSFVAAEPRKNAEVVRTPPPPPLKHTTYSKYNARRSGFNLNSASDGASQKFRVVRDNRVNQNTGSNSKPAQSATSTSERPVESNTNGTSGRQKSPLNQHSSQALSGPTASRTDQTKDALDKSAFLREKNLPSTSRMHSKINDPNPQSTNLSISSVVGVYSSASDPVHVPSLHPRPAANVGAIRRDVGVVGPRRQLSDNTTKSSSQSVSVPNSQSGPEVNTKESTKQSGVSKVDQPSQNVTTVSSVPGMTTSRSFSSNQHGGRAHQPNQKAPQPNKEWKRKSSPKASVNGPGIIGSPAKPVSPPAENSHDLRKEVQMGDAMSQLSISENQNVIIASHIRVSETDRGRLTFGTLGTELRPPTNSAFLTNGISFGTLGTEDLSTKPSGSVSMSVPESSGEETTVNKQLEMVEESVRSSESDSPASGAADNQLSEKNESLAPTNLDNYAGVGLVRDNGLSYTPETLPQQDTSELRSFSQQGFEPQMGYDVSYFRPMVDETVRGSGLSSSQEQMMGQHTTNTIPASIAMVQHQQQQLAQMYHYANLMPYRQYISPVYVPPMPVPGYSNSPAAYPHPSNGGSYVLMPGNSSHLTPQGLKYGIQQFKPVPTGSQTGFGNFSGPTGYAVNAPGVVGNASGHEDSSRIKYKDSLYVPNPQTPDSHGTLGFDAPEMLHLPLEEEAETSEMWMNPRDIPGLQSAASYFNMSGQTPHAYLPSHSGHTSYNPAAAAQSSHMQFGPGMYHPSNQPTAIPSPHHMGLGNVGVGVAGPAPGAQVGAYQQPQLGHINWAGNF